MKTRADINRDTGYDLRLICSHCHIPLRVVAVMHWDRLHDAVDTEAFRSAVADICLVIHDAIDRG